MRGRSFASRASACDGCDVIRQGIESGTAADAAKIADLLVSQDIMSDLNDPQESFYPQRFLYLLSDMDPACDAADYRSCATVQRVIGAWNGYVGGVLMHGSGGGATPIDFVPSVVQADFTESYGKHFVALNDNYVSPAISASSKDARCHTIAGDNYNEVAGSAKQAILQNGLPASWFSAGCDDNGAPQGTHPRAAPVRVTPETVHRRAWAGRGDLDPQESPLHV